MNWENDSETDKFYKCWPDQFVRDAGTDKETVLGVTRVSYMQIGTAKFQTNFRLQNFPFDTQTLKIRLFSDCSADDVRLVRNMEEKKASLMSDLVFQNEIHEYEMSKILRLHAIFKNAKHSGSSTPRCALDIDIHIRRRALFWLLNVWFPLCTFTGLSFCSFAVEVTYLSGRLAITLTILLTLVAYRFAMMNTLPRISYFNWMDIYFQVCFLVVVAVTVHEVALAVKAEESFAYLQPTGENTWQNPVPSYQTSQATVGWVISVVWAGLNAVAVCVGFFVHHRGRQAWLFGGAGDTTLWVGLSEKNGWGTIKFEDEAVQEIIGHLPIALGGPLTSILENSRLVCTGDSIPTGEKLTHFQEFSIKPGHNYKSRWPPSDGDVITGGSNLLSGLIDCWTRPAGFEGAPSSQHGEESTSKHPELWRFEDIRLPLHPGEIFHVISPAASTTVRSAVHSDIPLEMIIMKPGSSLPPAQPQWLLIEFQSQELARAARLILQEAFPSSTGKPPAKARLEEWHLEAKDAAPAAQARRMGLLDEVRAALTALALSEAGVSLVDGRPRAVCEMALPEYKYMLQYAHRKEKQAKILRWRRPQSLLSRRLSAMESLSS